MVIHHMSGDECLQVLAGARLARLACARENQPYVVPVFLAYAVPPGGEPCLYGFTSPGQKVEWMRENPRVCVEVDNVATHDDWVSVIALGRYEELPDLSGRNEELLADNVFQHGRYEGPDAPKRSDPRLLAHEILQTHAVWWEPAATASAARPHHDPHEPFVPVYYRILIGEVTGRRATPNPKSRTSS